MHINTIFTRFLALDMRNSVVSYRDLSITNNSWFLDIRSVLFCRAFGGGFLQSYQLKIKPFSASCVIIYNLNPHNIMSRIASTHSVIEYGPQNSYALQCPTT